jgi:LmbE family N-acetylglucosaminyl deacetylase
MTPETLLVVLAHPDDESFSIGGTLGRAVAEGKQVHLAVATRGEAGIPPTSETVDGPVAFIDVGSYLVQKVHAAQQHQSQNPPFPGDPKTEAQNMACHEQFRLVRPQVSANGHGPIEDLFANLNGIKPP